MKVTSMRRAGSLLATAALAAGTLAMTATTANAVTGPYGIVSGSVTQPGGAGLPGTQVEFYRPATPQEITDGDDDIPGYVEVDDVDVEDDGTYALSITPGTYHVIAHDDYGVFDDKVVDGVAVANGGETAANFQLSPRATPPSTFGFRIYPKVAGLPQVGVPLTVNPGAFSQSGVTASYQWYSDDAAIANATGTVYVPTANDVGSRVSVVVTGTKAGFIFDDEGYARPEPSNVVKKGSYVFATGPRITGAPAIGVTLTANPGALVPGAALSFQWFRNGKALTGATSVHYKAVKADRGKTLSAIVTYKTFGYTTVVRKVVAPFTVRKLAKEKASVTGGKRTATFKVTISPKATKKLKGALTIRENGQKVKGVSIKSGKATIKVKGLKKGKHTYTITYKGKKYANEKTVTVKVK